MPHWAQGVVSSNTCTLRRRRHMRESFVVVIHLYFIRCRSLRSDCSQIPSYLFGVKDILVSDGLAPALAQFATLILGAIDRDTDKTPADARSYSDEHYPTCRVVLPLDVWTQRHVVWRRWMARGWLGSVALLFCRQWQQFVRLTRCDTCRLRQGCSQGGFQVARNPPPPPKKKLYIGLIG